MAEIPVELILAPELSAAQGEDLVGLFSDLGIQVDMRRRFTHRGADELNMLVLLALPLQAFLSGLGSQIVKDIYQSAKATIQARKTGSQHGRELVPLVMQDNVTGLRIILDPDLPVEAIHQLATLDTSAYKIGPLHYDRHRHAWRSELDEAVL